ncbi:BAR-domain-containing protein [Backusella circina FSU 941]|nr:BAR-domain-containing protein [Backusella circina FSU 941]
MSWKGLQKAVNRLPYQLLSKKSESTKDPEYLGYEKSFKEFSKQTEVLARDARIFRDGIAALLSNQAAMAQYLAVIYDSNLGTQVPEGAVQKRFQQTPAAALQSVNDAEAAMAYCRDEVLPELDVVDRDIVRPLMELGEIIKVIEKTMIKRDHKLIDYDRHRIALQKINNKTERSFSEEKQIFKIQSQLDTATQDYDYLNNMLKSELPRFFQMKASFIKPVFESLYNMQSRIYGMLYARCYELFNQNVETFVSSSMGIEEGYNWRKMQRDARAELENTDLLKGGGKAWLAVSGGGNNSKLSLQERAAIRKAEEEGTAGYGGVPGGYDNKAQEAGYGYNNAYQSPSSPIGPPAYGANVGSAIIDATPMNPQEKPSYNYNAIPGAPPAPPAISNRGMAGGHASYVTALYDYAAQAEGDLSFHKGDRIEIVERTQDVNDWWTGRVNGVTGVFPGNYVE